MPYIRDLMVCCNEAGVLWLGMMCDIVADVIWWCNMAYHHVLDWHQLKWHMWLSNKVAWWRHRMETFSTLLAFCAGNSPVTGEFSAQRPVMRSFDVFFDLSLNQLLSQQWRRRWFEMPSLSLWCHCNGVMVGSGSVAVLLPGFAIRW